MVASKPRSRLPTATPCAIAPSQSAVFLQPVDASTTATTSKHFIARTIAQNSRRPRVGNLQTATRLRGNPTRVGPGPAGGHERGLSRRGERAPARRHLVERVLHRIA